VERAIGVGANHADALALLARYVATLLDRPNEAVSLMNRSFVLNPHAPTWYFLHHIRVAYFGRLFELALDHFARIKSDPAASILPIRPQMMFRILALAQLGREVEVGIAVRELCEIDANLNIISTEAAFNTGAARDLFEDGLYKAHLPVAK
jgi:adenylate cyclase